MDIYSVPTICIVGDQGAGKTRLASTFPDSYCLDTEDGAASAYPPERRKRFPLSNDLPKQLITEIERLAALPYKDKRLYDGDLKIGCVVLDTIDATQQVHKYFDLIGRKYRDNYGLWRDLLDDMMPLILHLKSLKVPQIIVAHVKIEEPVYRWSGDAQICTKRGSRALASQGQLEDQMKRWFDYILHLMVVEDGKRKCFVQPTIFEDHRITAKDRHNLFKELLDGKPSFTITADENGFPVTKAMQVIYESHIY